MKFLQKETLILSLFVFLGTFDLLLRFFWLDRENWTCNTGIFWGLPVESKLLSLLVLAILLGLALFWYQSKEEDRWGISLLILGGSINAVDRLSHGCVLDYFVWPFGLAQFLPNFNLADMFLSLGLLSYFWMYILKKKEKEH